ncbi:hypothetical protein OJ997_33510 [Solirubrobacter phytolaccae]|uniref:Uncharacterized protein n=1 Tax=Solirubrobacter phytolaccae TaxID=1404360 RepID=A0A9X3SD01_9ACTN|nr:hypothetical protein [Solirubrobacter phytolaccae]MDA0185271.1 hypothetical protein [Solirubrobacter phytolaccae]
MRLGIADHLGWAVAVVADDEHEVVDRRRIELVEPGVTPAPIHYAGPKSEEVVAHVRASVARATTQAFDALPGPITSISLRLWPLDFPEDLETQLRAPYEARADAVMYRQILADLAHARDWALHCYDAKSVEAQATALLGDAAHDVLHGPRRTLGPPWAKDHRTALAATVLAATRPARRPGASARRTRSTRA